MAGSRFKKLFRSACLESSILGFKYLFLYPDKFSRVFWTVSLGLMFGLACLLTQLLWRRFIELPTRMSIESQFSPIYDIPFPAVAVCSPNQVATSHARHLKQTLIDGDQSLELDKVLPYLMGYYEQISLPEAWRLTDLQMLLELNRYDIREVVATLPQTCDDFLRACYWEGERVDCGAIFRPVLTEYGLCCGFNTPYRLHNHRLFYDGSFEPRKARVYGATHGLTVITDYQPEDNLPGTLLNEGATQILFHDPTEFPCSDERTMVPPHVESYHVIQATVTNCTEEVAALPIERVRDNPFSRKCVFEDEYKLRYFHQYRNSQCDTDCYMSELYRHCHCVLLHMPYRGPPCNATAISCIINARNLLTNETLAMELCDCPRECMSTKYKIKSTLGNLDAIQHIFHDQYDGVDFTSNTAIIHIYYQNPFYVTQRQETIMSYINLISNLGGVFGLCLGCSVVSVLEIGFFVSRAVRAGRRRRAAAARWRRLKMVVLYQQRNQALQQDSAHTTQLEDA